MTNLITKEFDWDAASKQVLSNLDNTNTGARERVEKPVSYTHLTLPTIYSV